MTHDSEARGRPQVGGVRGGTGKLHAIEIEWFKRSFQWLQFNKP